MQMTLGRIERAAIDGAGCLLFLLLAIATAVLVGWGALEWACR